MKGLHPQTSTSGGGRLDDPDSAAHLAELDFERLRLASVDTSTALLVERVQQFQA